MIDHAGVAALVHALFEYGAIALGVALYRRARLRTGLGGLTQSGGFAVVAGLLIGAALGNKLVFLIERPDIWQRMLGGDVAMPGQSIVGGLLGGLIGVEMAKALTRQTRSTGDAMVWPIAIGLAFGRIGCFVAGLHDDTYGVATALPWGVDFGDGIARHPTQGYDAIIVLGLAAAVNGRFTRVPGLPFKLFLSGYLLWRFGIDGLKPVPHPYAFGWSGIQWVCALALAVYTPIVLKHWKRQFDGAPAAHPA
jgi:phosphatidylglycerol:prolipoprotein diacylglycerol transferase